MAISAILSRHTEEMIFDQLLLQWGKVWETTVLIISAILSKTENINWYLAKFATLSKTVANNYFDHICHTEQRYGRSDNLTSFTTLGETQIR